MAEPDWVREVVWWRVYPLGATGAYPTAGGEDEHRLLRLVPWLDHVAELGCTGLALGPVFASMSHGYDTVDHFRVDPRLGDDDDLIELIEQAHARGLRVQLDGVFNHVGRDHPLAAEPGWVRMTEGDNPRPVTFEGHDQLVTLNHDDQRVRDLVVEVLQHWLGRGADAWRLDAAYAVPTSFWAEVLPQVRSTHPDVWFEAEVIHGDYAGFVADSTADTVTQYELWKAIWSSINDRNLHELAWSLTRHDRMLETFVPATFIGNHDVTRIASRIDDRRHLEHAVVLLALLGGTPTVYSGDEFGLQGIKEERAGGDDAIRPPLLARPDLMPDADDRLLGLYRRLLALRRQHPRLHRARTEAIELRNEVATFAISADAHRLVMALNLGDEQVPAPEGDLVDGDEGSRVHPDAVAPHGWAIFG